MLELSNEFKMLIKKTTINTPNFGDLLSCISSK